MATTVNIDLRCESVPIHVKARLTLCFAPPADYTPSYYYFFGDDNDDDDGKCIYMRCESVHTIRTPALLTRPVVFGSSRRLQAFVLLLVAGR
jgi:hypothetical protein